MCLINRPTLTPKETQDVLIILGDLNAKVGRKDNQEEQGIIGHFALRERNDRGNRLVDFATMNQLY